MHFVYHAGEIAVQERAGVRQRAERLAGSVRAAVPPIAQAFLAERRWLVLAAVDESGRPWATLLAGPPGFVATEDGRTVRVEALPAEGDPLAATLEEAGEVGLLAIDLPTRRRMRLNGRFERVRGALMIRVEEVYSNCARYIHPRPDPADAILSAGARPGPAGVLTDTARERIRRADTVFAATASPGGGADASHRGGEPGFIAVEGDRLAWPDYPGNSMFNTLGNIAAFPRAGLLVPDFETGAALQVSGRAAIRWEPARSVELVVDAVVG